MAVEKVLEGTSVPPLYPLRKFLTTCCTELHGEYTEITKKTKQIIIYLFKIH
jgi:hypothetical protein